MQPRHFLSPRSMRGSNCVKERVAKDVVGAVGAQQVAHELDELLLADALRPVAVELVPRRRIWSKACEGDVVWGFGRRLRRRSPP